MNRGKFLSYFPARLAGTLYMASEMDIEHDEYVYSVSDPEDIPETRKYSLV